MTIELDALRYLAVIEEAAGSYGIDQSAAFPTGYLAFPYKEGSLEADPAQAQFDPMAGTVYADGHRVKVLGPKRPTVKLTSVLHSHGLDLAGDVASPDASTWALLRVLKILWGGLQTAALGPASAQTKVLAGTTTTAVTVTAGHGVRFPLGTAIACQLASGAGQPIEAREILSVAGDVISVKEAFSSIPTTTTNVRGSVTIFPKEDPDTSLQMVLEGRETSDRWAFGGLQGGFALAYKPNDFVDVVASLTGAFWKRLSSGAGVTIPSYANFNPMLAVAAELHVPTVGSTTRVVVDDSEFAIEFGLAYADILSGAGVDGIKRKRRQIARPLVKGSFVTPWDTTWETARTNRENRALFKQIGNLVGGTCLVSAPAVQIVDFKRAVASGVASGIRVMFEGRRDASLAASLTEIMGAAGRLHFF